MPVKARGNAFQATVSHKRSKYRRQFPTAIEAQLWEAQTKADLLSGKTAQTKASASANSKQRDHKATEDSPETLGEMFNYIYRTTWRDAQSKQALKQVGTMLTNVLGGDILVNDIGKKDIDRVTTHFKEMGNTNGTVNRKLAALSKALTTGEELGIVTNRPKIKYLREAPHRIRWYNDKEMADMEMLCNGPFSDTELELEMWDFGHYLRFMADTGLRQSEAFNLTWRDWRSRVDGGNSSVIYVDNSKNGLSRTVPLTKEAEKALVHMKNNSAVGPWRGFTKIKLRARWDFIRRRMGWQDDTQAVLHSLRHTFCSRLVQKGVPLRMVQELAGHKGIAMTLRYSHLVPHDLSQCISLLESKVENTNDS